MDHPFGFPSTIYSFPFLFSFKLQVHLMFYYYLLKKSSLRMKFIFNKRSEFSFELNTAVSMFEFLPPFVFFTAMIAFEILTVYRSLMDLYSISIQNQSYNLRPFLESRKCLIFAG